MRKSGKRVLHSRPVSFLLKLTQLFFEHQAMRTAAQISYYLLFSLFPLLLVVVSTIGYLHLDVDTVTRIMEALPTSGVVNEYITYVLTNESPTMLWTGIISAVIASSAAFRALMSITGEVAGRPTFNMVLHVIVSFLMSIVLLLTIFIMMLAVVSGHWLLSLIQRRFKATALMIAWQWLRFPTVFGLGVLALTALYRVCLSKKALPEGRAWPGALFASVALVAGTALFSMFISMSSKYSLVYGSLAGIIILMLWLFVLANILVLGTLINCVLAKKNDEDEPTRLFRGL
jgi:membrane protein